MEAGPEEARLLVVVSAIEGLGRPWMLGTDAIYRHGRDLVTLGPVVLTRMLDSTPVLRNLVSATNGRAIRLLVRWGFVVEQGEAMIGGVPFREFWMRRDV